MVHGKQAHGLMFELLYGLCMEHGAINNDAWCNPCLSKMTERNKKIRKKKLKCKTYRPVGYAVGKKLEYSASERRRRKVFEWYGRTQPIPPQHPPGRGGLAIFRSWIKHCLGKRSFFGQKIEFEIRTDRRATAPHHRRGERCGSRVAASGRRRRRDRRSGWLELEKKNQFGSSLRKSSVRRRGHGDASWHLARIRTFSSFLPLHCSSSCPLSGNRASNPPPICGSIVISASSSSSFSASLRRHLCSPRLPRRRRRRRPPRRKTASDSEAEEEKRALSGDR